MTAGSHLVVICPGQAISCPHFQGCTEVRLLQSARRAGTVACLRAGACRQRAGRGGAPIPPSGRPHEQEQPAGDMPAEPGSGGSATTEGSTPATPGPEGAGLGLPAVLPFPRASQCPENSSSHVAPRRMRPSACHQLAPQASAADLPCFSVSAGLMLRQGGAASVTPHPRQGHKP